MVVSYLKMLKQYRPKLIWSDAWAEHYFNFKESNTRNRAFYPSLASLRERLLLVQRLNCGLSMQFLEKGLPIFYNLLNELDNSLM